MQTHSNIVPIFGESFEKNVEKYFEDFLVFFHSDNEEYRCMVPSRRFIRNFGEKLLKGESYFIARSIIANQYGHLDEKLIFTLSERIFQYFLSYRKEHLSRVRILVNNILG
ncbi:hypothetical protein GW819_03405 [Candidatus Gracilibacteria bacterium]|nr:hypothetical protein [Candidatus Gracilibacteria bacterium]OIO76236.1 MAG: hypothetical protein AUJ87_03205 [Candidatus Gracilibacteria bacterium CG1_02_38_174]PIQ11564.1 MAG: hypothetical protein COW68_02520 [Candidatus Gracilibacteria bacterium CG18_big_fil_WC_8_21_14_2_50_38_16]PIQ42302.1 MAG: hypothetical protein COW06_00150 [Candidatus Gracilibacteria bacterium CG12_big_fil_rev_8_21_14_0_65_38_15]PIZ02084.1 MAG: hypothetical protein COY60_00235 [Candidatus Gracilibacteria bacterium CG_4